MMLGVNKLSDDEHYFNKKNRSINEIKIFLVNSFQNLNAILTS